MALLLAMLLALAPLQSASAESGFAARSSGSLLRVAGWPSFGAVPSGVAASEDSFVSADAATRERVEAGLGKLPLYFVENRGQIDARAAYYVQGSTTSVYFTKTGIVYALRGTEGGVGHLRQASATPADPGNGDGRGHAIRLDFEGANPDVKLEGRQRTAAVVSYFKGRPSEWQTGLPSFGRIVYEELWPGIDLVYEGVAGRLKYSFVVKPGADPRRIRLVYRGASEVRVTAAGRLAVETLVGGFEEEAPYAYQGEGNVRTEVQAAFEPAAVTLDGAHRVGFHLGAYDESRTLVLDPVVLLYCGYLGGSGADVGRGIAVDSSGNAYVAGYTASNNFPVSVGPDLSYNLGPNDAFVAKVNAAGTALIYAGYIGGSGDDQALAIAVDAAGSAYLTGTTTSTAASFPETVGPDLSDNGAIDAFVAKIDASGTALVYCGFLGGSADEVAHGIAVDGAGNAYVVGRTGSSAASFPETVGPDLTYNGGFYDAFVAKVDAAGAALVYCGYLGGLGDDVAHAVALDSSGNAYLTGNTSSTAATFPETVGPDLTHNGGFNDAFVAKVDAGGAGLVYCGYIGGAAEDGSLGIAVDTTGAAYVTGNTNSTQAQGFPLVAGPDLTYNGGLFDAWVSKVKPVPSDPTPANNFFYSGYIGGLGDDPATAIAVDGSGYAYVIGRTASSEASFPVVLGPDLTFGGSYDVFVTKIKPAPNDAVPTNNFVYSGYIGGSGDDFGTAVAVDGAGNAFVTGSTASTQAQGFPVLVGPNLTYNGGGSDAFVAKISSADCCSLSTTEIPGSTVTVTGAGQFEMRFNTATGGGIDTFYDLALDPARSVDLVGSIGNASHDSLFLEELEQGGGASYWTNERVAAASQKLDLLEATPTRVRVRAESFYGDFPGGNFLPGLKATGDYSVYPSGRMALRWNRRAASNVPYTSDWQALTVHYRSPTDPLSNWATYSQTGLVPTNGLQGTGSQDFLLSRIEQPQAATDFLLISAQDWPAADVVQNRQVAAPDEALSLTWRDSSTTTITGGTSQAWDYLTYFKPTNLGVSASPWLDPAVTSRSADYRTHPAGEITINAGKGLAWSDTVENTAAGTDWFNEAEAVYPLELHQTLGLDFDLDGSTRRYSPFFKIRGWRSFVETPTVTLEGVALRNNVDYKAAVKPFAKAYVREILWYSSLDNAGFITSAGIGSPGAVTGAVGFVAARYGSGASTTLDTRYVSFPTIDNFAKAKGGISFWYQPTYASNDSLEHDLAGTWSSATNAWYLKKAADNNLYFRIVTSAGTSDLVVTAANYSWRASDWVHLRLQWDDAAPLATQQRLFVNGREPPRTAPAVDYNSALFTPGANFVIRSPRRRRPSRRASTTSSTATAR